MSSLGSALAAGVRAPWSRFRLVAMLWLARIVPILLAFGLPAYERASRASAHHPDSGRLLEGANDRSGFVYAWTSDFFRTDFADASDRVFWLVVVVWALATFLAGGIVARLVHGGGSGLFLAECGRYAGRFLRLGLTVLALFYAVDLAFNALLLEHHRERELLHQTQDYAIERAWVRGLPFVAIVYILGLVHAYARIDVVANDRRSAVLSMVRGLGILVARLPWLLGLELAMLLATGVAILLATAVPRFFPLSGSSTWIAVSVYLALAALTSFLRTGIEVGAMEARSILLVGGPEPRPSQIETDGSWIVETPGESGLPES